MRCKSLIFAACAILLLLYVSLYYYEIIPSSVFPDYNYIVDEYHFTSSPHMRAARETHFLPKIECGSGWQEEYGEFHRKALQENGKVLVSVAVEGGIADNLSGLMSEFYLALLSKRALQIYEYGYLPKYEPAFNYAYFNWSNPGIYPDILTNNLKYTYHGQRGWEGDRSYPPEVDTTVNWCIYQMNDYYYEKDRMFTQLNLTRDFPENRTHVKNLFMVSNRGMTYRLAYENPNHNETFAKMGIKPEFMFGCAFRALFKPTAELIRRNEQYLKILTNPSIKKIGIMVRTGDGSFGESKISDQKFNEFSPYFQCAEEIEMVIRQNSTQPILWYLLSDSLDFRRRAKIKYGTKILTDVETNFIHPDCMAHDPARCSYELTEVAMMQAAGQVINFAWTDYQVISRWSGFGRVGAVLGAGENHIYSIPRDNNEPCDETHYDSWKDKISQDWAGI